MSSRVRFSPDLGAWLVEQLNGGRPPLALVETMVAERMEPRVASAIVAAFVAARSDGRPVPTDSLLLEDEPEPYRYEPPLLAPGSRLRTADREVRVVMRSERPCLAVLEGLLTDDECSALIELGRPRLTPSTLVDPETGQDIVASGRTSFGMFFRPRENALVARIDRRLSEVMGLPEENGEGLQLLHYPALAESTPHFDFLRPTNDANRASIERSGQRVSTLLAYLNDVEAGGETLFPALGSSVSPARGRGVYFEYANSLGQVDERSLHAGGPVLSGEKWVATKWMRRRRFVPAAH